MSDLIGIAYTSRATHGLPPWRMDGLLMDARRFNRKIGVSGVLFHHDGDFFQYFEGPPAAASAVYARIRASRSHDGIRELSREGIDRRQFSSWTMAFCEPPRSMLQTSSQATWLNDMPVTRDTFDSTEGMNLVLYYWNRWQAEATRGPGRLSGAQSPAATPAARLSR